MPLPTSTPRRRASYNAHTLNASEPDNRAIYVAPMMSWTDRHCRFLLRQYSSTAILFTEMISTQALLTGGQWHLLDHDPAEHPLVLQLGGNDPAALAACARTAADKGFAEVNLNVGCPSPRVQRGAFGACLMREPELVAECIAAMRAAVSVPVSVKCRLGVDDWDSDALLDAFVDSVAAGGCSKFYVHARKAVLGGLTPAQNRSVPPLQYDRVKSLKARRPHLTIILNGGIGDRATAEAALKWSDGIMIGRAAYQDPSLLSELDEQPRPEIKDIYARYRAYIAGHLSKGVKLHAMTRHMLSMCNGMRGARQFRRTLSDHRRLSQNDLALLDEAIACV